MKFSFLIGLLCMLMSSIGLAQHFEPILTEYHGDSSFYSIAKVSDNEFWIGGENGILKSIDTLGNLTSIHFPEPRNILKIIYHRQAIFFATDESSIFKYDINTKAFEKYYFPKLKGRCFYDMILMPNESIMVCGGANGIANAKKTMPKGFIGIINPERNKIDIVWKSWRRFAWSLIVNVEQAVYVSIFNGKNSKISKVDKRGLQNDKTKVKGLVHELYLMNNQIWYCGSNSINFQKDGIVGCLNLKNTNFVCKNSGCIWSLSESENKIFALSNANELVVFNQVKNALEFQKLSIKSPFYEMIKVTANKFLAIGHGRRLCWIQ